MYGVTLCNGRRPWAGASLTRAARRFLEYIAQAAWQWESTEQGNPRSGLALMAGKQAISKPVGFR